MKAFALPALPATRFANDEDERLFSHWELPARLNHYLITGWMALVTYNMFLLMDWMVGPEVFEIGLKGRLGLCTSMALPILICGLTHRRWMLTWRPRTIDWAIASPGLMGALGVAIVATSQPLQGSLWSVFYHAGFAPIILYGTLVQRLRFKAASVLTGAILLVHWGSLIITPPVPDAPVLPIFMFVLAVSVYTLMLNLKLEQEDRLRFAQHQRATHVRAQLDHSHRQLAQAALSDALTNVANRRGLDRYMDEHWPTAQQSKRAFALLLIDVDHFKAFNDGHGHPAGDVCLRHVARALQHSVRDTRGLLARWGGEEFVIALPDTDDEGAMQVAQRALHEVRASAIRHAHSPIGTIVTVSVGVASSQSLPEDLAWSGLLARADLALYQAKRQGRDRAMLMAPYPTGTHTTNAAPRP